MGVTISSWMTDSSGWQTMNRMQAATFSGGWRFSGPFAIARSWSR